MPNDELKKKIKEILRKRMTELLGSCHTDEIPLTEEGAEAIMFYADEFADALIAAGIVDKSDYASMKETAVRYKAEVSKAGARVKEAEAEANRYEMLYKLQNRDMALAERRAHDAEHRAARAERALDLCETAYILSLNHRATEGISGQAIASDFGIHKFFMKQAEKELAEEGKDGNKTD